MHGRSAKQVLIGADGAGGAGGGVCWQTERARLMWRELELGLWMMLFNVCFAVTWLWLVDPHTPVRGRQDGDPEWPACACSSRGGRAWDSTMAITRRATIHWWTL
jgi:hypothetical protein